MCPLDMALNDTVSGVRSSSRVLMMAANQIKRTATDINALFASADTVKYVREGKYTLLLVTWVFRKPVLACSAGSLVEFCRSIFPFDLWWVLCCGYSGPTKKQNHRSRRADRSYIVTSTCDKIVGILCSGSVTILVAVTANRWPPDDGRWYANLFHDP